LSEIRVTTVSDTAGTGPVTLTKQYAAKILANINLQGTAAINASQGVSSITDNGTGDVTFSFTNNMGNTTYFHIGASYFDGSTTGIYTFGLPENVAFSTTRPVGSIRYEAVFASSSADRSNFDPDEAVLTIHGDLA